MVLADRVVMDVITLFGDIGGLAGFFMTILGLMVGSYPGILFSISKAEELFRVNLTSPADENQAEDSQ